MPRESPRKSFRKQGTDGNPPIPAESAWVTVPLSTIILGVESGRFVKTQGSQQVTMEKSACKGGILIRGWRGSRNRLFCS
jgi:hypothetical protein